MTIHSSGTLYITKPYQNSKTIQAQRGASISNVELKTVALLPHNSYKHGANTKTWSLTWGLYTVGLNPKTALHL